jgi:hypothetical protein
MPKFVLRSKSAPDYFYKHSVSEGIAFTNKIEEAKCFDSANIEHAEINFIINYSQLINSLFDVYEVPKIKYAIRVVGTELYVESIFNYVQFTEELFYVLEKSCKESMNQILDQIKHKVKSKLEIVKL